MKRQWYYSIPSNDAVFNKHLEYYLEEYSIKYEWEWLRGTNGFKRVKAYMTQEELATLEIYFGGGNI